MATTQIDVTQAHCDHHEREFSCPTCTSAASGPKQSTRQIKIECLTCGFVMRTTRKWIATADEGSGLTCPVADCGQEVHVFDMHVPTPSA